ncbi:MAG: dihydrolipoamide acetyltransferase family protein [Elusimicrobiota bacterium]
MAYEFRLPDIGEGLTEGEVVKWHVAEGDSVAENQPLVNVLTDKAEVEIPSPKTGTIRKILFKSGDKVEVGAVLVEIDSADGAAAKPQAAAAPARVPGASVSSGAPHAASGTQVSATPAVRKLAAELKLDLASVAATGPGGRITEEDVRKAVRSAAPAEASAGPVERVPFKGVRRRTAEKMTLAARTIPHVTHGDEADATELAALREKLKGEAEKKGVKLTYLAFLLRALVPTLKEFPNLNASLDEGKEEIVLKKHYHIGFAVAAEQGLYVPVLRDADKKDLWQLAREIAELSGKARENKLGPAELSGGTFSVTSIGSIGGLWATPIILHPQSAILGVMKMQERPVARGGKVAVRTMLNLALSFDHRLLDGAEAAAFMNAFIKRLEAPASLV